MNKLANKISNLGVEVSVWLILTLFVMIPLVGVIGLGKLLLSLLGVI